MAVVSKVKGSTGVLSKAEMEVNNVARVELMLRSVVLARLTTELNSMEREVTSLTEELSSGEVVRVTVELMSVLGEVFRLTAELSSVEKVLTNLMEKVLTSLTEKVLTSMMEKVVISLM